MAPKLKTANATVAKLRSFVKDGWENITTGLGTSRDKRSGNRIASVPTNQNRQVWEDMYHGDDTQGKT